jgi:ketosteroid isomerase-like protein
MSEKSEKDMMAGVFDTTLANYADNAVSMPNNGPMLKGKAAIKEYFQKEMGMGMKFTKVDFTTVDVQVSGSFAVETGTYSMTIEMPAMANMPPIQDEGKYLTVYEKAADGSWKIKVETWNTNKMPPMPGSAS